MTTYGVTLEGFAGKTLQDTLEEINAEVKAQISPSINTSASSLVGNYNGIYAAKNRELWELIQAIHAAMYPSSASGVDLDEVCSITGTVRRDATASYVLAQVALEAGTTLEVGSAATVIGDPSTRFVTTQEITNSTDDPATFDVMMQADRTGPVSANAGTLTVIATPVSGWNSITNPEDAVLGTDIESDASLRLKRAQNLQYTGAGTFGAMKAKLRAMPGMINAEVFDNDKNITDENGVPPHAFEALIYDGASPAVADEDIAQLIWTYKPLGIQPYGEIEEEVVIGTGQIKTIKFSRPEVVDVWVRVTVAIDATTFPVDGDDQIIAQIVAYGDAHQASGDDVIVSQYYESVFNVPGVTDITLFESALTEAGLAEGNLVMGIRQIADIDTSRVIVEHAP